MGRRHSTTRSGGIGGPDPSDQIRTAILDGHSREDHVRIAAAVRRQLQTLVTGLSSVAGDYNTAQRPAGYNLLSRLVRASDPGVVVASAADSGEIDPLRDFDARLTVGLPVD